MWHLILKIIALPQQRLGYELHRKTFCFGEDLSGVRYTFNNAVKECNGKEGCYLIFHDNCKDDDGFQLCSRYSELKEAPKYNQNYCVYEKDKQG